MEDRRAEDWSATEELQGKQGLSRAAKYTPCPYESLRLKTCKEDLVTRNRKGAVTLLGTRTRDDATGNGSIIL